MTGITGATAVPGRRSIGSEVVFGVATVCGVAISANVAAGHSIPTFDWKAFWLLALWATSWAVAVAAALRLPRKLSLVLILAAAAALRVAALAGSPTTSDDLYRYAWDGRVQVGGTDPYADPPASASLVQFRESWLWPDSANCAALHRPVGCTRLNRPAVRTIYPPLAEAWFATVYRIGGTGARHKSWQIAGMVTDLLTVGLLMVALRRWGVDQRWAALYALCPMAVFEIVNNAHVDGLAICLVVAAASVAVSPTRPQGSRRQWPTSRGWTRPLGVAWRDVAVGALLGGATIVKLYPALLLVAVIGLPRPHPWRSLARSVGVATGVVALGYLPHIVVVGVRVIGYLPGYLKEERYSGGGRFLIAGLLGVHGSVTTAVAGAALAAIVAWVLWRRPPFPRAASVLLAALFLTTTPAQPWYALSLVAIGALTAWPWWTVVALAGEPYYFAVILGYRHAVGLGRTAYGVALVGVIAGCATSRMVDGTWPGEPEGTTAAIPSLLAE